MPSDPNPSRNAELAKIHLAKKQLGLDDETYRSMLWTVARVHSAKDLDSAGRRAVLDHLAGRGWKGKPKKSRAARTTPPADREALVRKVQALMREANVFSAYVDGMSRRMFQVDRWEWLNPDQLHRLVAALNYHIKRHGRHDSRS